MNGRLNQLKADNQAQQTCTLPRKPVGSTLSGSASGFDQLLHKPPKKAAGFTLIEIIVTVAVAAVLASIGVPRLQNTIQDNRITTLYNGFLTDLNYTRNAAITFASPVTLCKRNSAGNDCDTTTANDWSEGWLVFHDKDGDGAVDSDEKILLDNTDASSKTSLIFTGNSNRVTYNAQGFARGYAGKVTFCDDRGNDSRKGMVISQNGRVRMADSYDTLSSCTDEDN